MDQERVLQLIEGAIAENKSLFLVDVRFPPGNHIYVEVDGDQGVPLKECIRISRAVEHNLDREEEDFSLEVSSPDLSSPLSLRRQYPKNIGRILQLTLQDRTKAEGRLAAVDDTGIELTWKAREPKPIGKGKVTVEKRRNIPFEEILEATVKITF
ncbi:MAG: ribosome assembly cofactor RimP [Lutibacter sp.]|jgi:ribosome maturation factor RimP|nr:ribosome assembly cofactor RimP [Lutibacter sp.]